MSNFSLRLVLVGCACAALVLIARPAGAQTAPSPSPSASPLNIAQTAPLTVASPAASSAPGLRRALPAPFDTLFTGGGGSEFNGPTIGVPTDPGVRAYGWLDPGIEESTSRYSNYPLTYDDVPNRVQMDQAVQRFELQPDTVQTDHIDWGFRIAPIYGENYRYTTAYGLFSSQLLNQNLNNGFDIPMA